MSDSILIPVWISLKTAVAATAITFCLGVIAAWWMSRYRGKAKALIEAILTAPLVLPPTVIGFLLLLALGKKGFLGQFLDAAGIRIVFTWYATVIAATVVAFPLMYKSALAAFEEIDDNLVDCARTLGVEEKAIFWRIILPLAKTGLITGVLLAFARALGEFGATLILAGSIPGKTQTIPIAIYLAAESGDLDRALRLVIVLLAISLSAIVGISDRDRHRLKGKQTKYRGSNTRLGNDRAAIALEVNIQKQLPDLLLDVAFKIDCQQNPLGILGKSGSGKTTLLRCIAGLESPDRGIIILNNRTLYDSAKGINLSPQEREVGLIWQDYALFPHFTVAENIALGMGSKLADSAIAQEIDLQLAQLDLTPLKHRLPQKLSGGEQQRVALARALASKPQLTLFDEPLSALDTDISSKLLRLLQKRLATYGGLTLYVTHNFEEAYSLCPQLLIMNRGKAISFDRKQVIFNYPPNLETAQIVGCNNFFAAKIINSQTIKAIAWQCYLTVKQPIPPGLNRIGIHAHQVRFVAKPAAQPEGINVFPAWLVTHSELADRVVLDLKLHNFPHHLSDRHLVAEVTWDKWYKLQQLPMPWYVQLPPKQIIMFDD